MKKAESILSNNLRRLLVENGCHIEKLHGGMYSSGLPDLLVLVPPAWNADGTLAAQPMLCLVEAKVVKKEPATVEDMFLLLRAGTLRKPSLQRAKGYVLARHLSPAFVLAFPSESLRERGGQPYAYISPMHAIVTRSGTGPGRLPHDDPATSMVLYMRRHAPITDAIQGGSSVTQELRNGRYLERTHRNTPDHDDGDDG